LCGGGVGHGAFEELLELGFGAFDGGVAGDEGGFLADEGEGLLDLLAGLLALFFFFYFDDLCGLFSEEVDGGDGGPDECGGGCEGEGCGHSVRPSDGEAALGGDVSGEAFGVADGCQDEGVVRLFLAEGECR